MPHIHPRITATLAYAIVVAAAAAVLTPIQALAVSADRQAKVVGGVTASLADWPFLAALVHPGAGTPFDRQFCGASVIAPDWVLSAAHCVVDSADAPVSPDQVSVLTGTMSLTAGAGTESPVSQVVVFPGYPGAADAAMLHLATPTTAPPVALAQPLQQSLWTAGTRAAVAGWGDTGEDADRFPLDARQVTVPIVSNTACRSALGDQVVPARELCAGLAAGKSDSCQGDSGGPLTVRVSGAQVLLGIVSWGNGCARAASPGVYTRVSSLIPWVTATLGGVAPVAVTLPAPVLRARAARVAGRPGAIVNLNYSVSGRARRSSEYIAILDARNRVLDEFETDESALAAGGGSYYVQWRMPRKPPASMYFCVAAAAPRQEFGNPSCARIVVRRSPTHGLRLAHRPGDGAQ